MKNKVWSFIVKLIILLLAGISLISAIFVFVYIFEKGRSVISWTFLLENPSGIPVGTEGGIYPAIAGSIYSGVLSTFIAALISVCAAACLSFYKGNLFTRILRVTILGLSGIPSILFGLASYTFLIYKMGITRSLLSASLAIAMMLIPFITLRLKKIFDEATKEYMKASLCLGISKEYTIRHMLLPYCRFDILSTLALSMAYGMGATAPIMYTGAVMQAAVPKSLHDPFMALPYHLYMIVNNGFELSYAYGTAFVLLMVLLILDLSLKAVGKIRKRKR